MYIINVAWSIDRWRPLAAPSRRRRSAACRQSFALLSYDGVRCLTVTHGVGDVRKSSRAVDVLSRSWRAVRARFTSVQAVRPNGAATDLRPAFEKQFWGDRPFVKRFALCNRTVVLSVCLSVCHVTLAYCRQTVGWIHMPLGMEVGLGPGHCLRWGPSSPPKGEQQPSPAFRPMSIVAKRLDGSGYHLVQR